MFVFFFRSQVQGGGGHGGGGGGHGGGGHGGVAAVKIIKVCEKNL